jgi:GTP-binding protein
MLPLVALVGRPNVGKSTLFNALTRTRDALVHDEPGVTRDRQYGLCRLEEGRHFAVCDTGGLTDASEGLAAATTKQSRAAAEEADLVLFIVDGRDGPTGEDDTILRWLRKTGRPIYLVVNKTDGLDVATCVNDFSRMGVDVVIPIAASHQRGVPELVQALLPRLPADRDAAVLDDGSDRMRVAFIGRPNVG